MLSALSMTAICMLAIVVTGLLEMQVTLARRRASSELIFGDNRVDEYRLTKRQAEDKESEIRRALAPRAAGFLGCSPIREFESKVAFTPPGKPTLLRTCYGRTVASAEDLAVLGLEFQSTGPAPYHVERGVIVSPRFLRDLAREPDVEQGDMVEFARLGSAVAADESSREALTLPIVGVTRQEFSTRWTFLVIEQTLNSLEHEHRDFDTRRARSRPVPEKFTNADLPRGIENLLRTRGIDQFRRTPDKEWIEFRANRRMNREQWDDLLRELRQEMAGFEQFSGDERCFSSPTKLIPEEESAPDENQAAQDLRTYDFISLLTNDPELVEELVRLAEPLPADPALAASLRQLAAVTRLSRVLWWSAAIAVLSVGGFSLGTVQYLHAATKRQEIGLLKALGMSDFRLRGLFILEAVSVTAVGALLAILGGAVGMGVSCFLFERADEFGLLTDTSVWWKCWGLPWLVNGVAAVLAAIAASVFGTRSARASSPIESFSAN